MTYCILLPYCGNSSTCKAALLPCLHLFTESVRKCHWCVIGVWLVGGQTSWDGRVEFKVGTEWRSICDIMFGTDEAKAICRHSGLSHTVVVYKGALFGVNTAITHPPICCFETGDVNNCTFTEAFESFLCVVVSAFSLGYGVIAGIVLGVLVFLILILCCVSIRCCCCYPWFLRRAASRKRRRDVKFISKDPYHEQAVLIESVKPKVYASSATSH